jgi:HK97 family phage portal protein
MTAAGMRVDAEGAKKISAWFRGRDILATALAMLPLKVYSVLPDDKGAEVASTHPLHDVLSRKPNAADDAFTWKRRAMFDIIDTGHAYNWIQIGRAWSLDRIDPRCVTFERIKSGAHKGRLLYYVRDETTGQTTTHTQDEIFHLRGADGKGILESARDNLGLAMTTEQYASRIFSRGTLNGGVIEVPGPMDPESARSMAQSFVTAAGEWHMPKVLPMGAKMADPKLALTPENAQMLLSRKFAISDVARWLGLPPHMIGDLDRATFSNIEHQGQEFVTYSLGPWLSLWEFAINDQLILQPNRFFAEFTRDALVRGDIAARWQAYQIAVQTGTWTRNEVRRKENMNALDGLDEPLDPAHLTGSQPPPAAGARRHVRRRTSRRRRRPLRRRPRRGCCARKSPPCRSSRCGMRPTRTRSPRRSPSSTTGTPSSCR